MCCGPGTYPPCHDAGPDGVFGTADDPRPATFASAVRMKHPAGSPRAGLDVTSVVGLAASGNRLLVSEQSPPALAGRQVWMVRGLDGDPIQVTSHYSAKTSPTLDPSGRLFWVDSVFVPSAVFVREP